MPRVTRLRYVLVFFGATVCCIVTESTPSPASCNVIPPAALAAGLAFKGNSGFIDTPFASPGQEVTIKGSPATSGEAALVAVFRGQNRQRNAVVIAENADCTNADVTNLVSQLSSCQSSGTNVFAHVECGTEALSTVAAGLFAFPFPDSSILVAGNDYVLTGPATLIVVEIPGSGSPCDPARTDCLSVSAGTLACIADLEPNAALPAEQQPDATLDGFTALPPANEFAKLCAKDTNEEPPFCERDETRRATDILMTIDDDGDVLIPMNWGSILEDLPNGGGKSRRQVQGSTAIARRPSEPNRPVAVPGDEFLDSFTIKGGSVGEPPQFDVLRDASHPQQLRLYGTADKDSSVLRISRRKMVTHACLGGQNHGNACSTESGKKECPPDGANKGQCVELGTLYCDEANPLSCNSGKCASGIGCPCVGGMCSGGTKDRLPCGFEPDPCPDGGTCNCLAGPLPGYFECLPPLASGALACSRRDQCREPGQGTPTYCLRARCRDSSGIINYDAPCRTDADCPGLSAGCGAALFDLSGRLRDDVGPLSLSRSLSAFERGICIDPGQLDHKKDCRVGDPSAACGGECVGFRAEAGWYVSKP